MDYKLKVAAVPVSNCWIMVPARRRVYVRNLDGSPVRDSVSVDIGFTGVTFSWVHTMRVDGVVPLLPAPNNLAAS